MKPSQTSTQAGRHLSATDALRAWVPVVAWLVLIFLGSAQPDFDFAPEAWQVDPISFSAHILEFGVLAALAWRAASRTPRLRTHQYLFALAIAILYGVLDEFHQHFVPGRVSDPRDLVADAVGAALALALIWWRQRSH